MCPYSISSCGAIAARQTSNLKATGSSPVLSKVYRWTMLVFDLLLVDTSPTPICCECSKVYTRKDKACHVIWSLCCYCLPTVLSKLDCKDKACRVIWSLCCYCLSTVLSKLDYQCEIPLLVGLSLLGVPPMLPWPSYFL